MSSMTTIHLKATAHRTTAMPTETIHWMDINTCDTYVMDFNPKFNINKQIVVERLIEMVKANGDCIMVGSYLMSGDKVSTECRMIEAVQLGDPMMHMGVVLGNNVGHLCVSGNQVKILQCPTSICETWDMRVLPFVDVEVGVRVIVDTARKCQRGGVGYNCHALENIEHMLSRLLNPQHGESDSGTVGDYEIDAPETWKRGLHCSQLVLVVLKRCVLHGALVISDTGLRRKFMDTYSHTCTPAILSDIIARTWKDEIKHVYMNFAWDQCFPSVTDSKKTMDLPALNPS